MLKNFLLILSLTSALLSAGSAKAAPGGNACLDFLSNNQPPQASRGSQPVFPSFSLHESLTYGLEIEYDVTENPQILLDYIPKNVNLEMWQKMSLPERSQTLRQLLGHSALERTASHLLGLLSLAKLPAAPSWAPSQVSVEAHGTVEISGIVVNTYQEFSEASARFEERYGKGYYQSHVVFGTAKVAGLAGFSLMDSDRSQLKSLSRGYEKYLDLPNVRPGANLLHYALGPLSEKSRDSILHAGASIQQGGNAGSGGAQRLIYGPALRDDVYPKGKVGYELRQYSSSRRALLDATWELSEILQNGHIADFQSYEGVEMITAKMASQLAAGAAEVSVEDVEAYLSGIGTYLRKKSAFVLTGGASFDERFLFPLRRWDLNPVLQQSLDPEEARIRVRNATTAYIKTFQQLILKRTPPETAVPQLQVAMGRWAYDADLAPLFDLFVEQSKTPHRTLPWNEPVVPARGPFLGHTLDPQRASLKILLPSDRQRLGLTGSASSLAFYNLSHENSRWAAVIEPSTVVGASLVTQTSMLNGKEISHVLIRIDLSGKGARLYEQSATGLGRTANVNSFFLSVGAQKDLDPAVGSSNRRTKKLYAIVFQAGSEQYVTNYNHHAKLDAEKLNLTPAQTLDFLKRYLEKSETEGGQDYFSLRYNSCASNCYLLMRNTVKASKGPSKLIETLLKHVTFNARWSEQLFRLNGWINE